ncbi:perlucin-like protein [Drosophila pseudoobscura]|uniref:Perlucin-like protein n=1 Tax=Drosophila pseudoobscura pseudoobscura TaxID=46245 RepID=A0A6I8UY44_DROPS|nr:perlucin-like protein [Drosophila pseudoobscura]
MAHLLKIFLWLFGLFTAALSQVKIGCPPGFTLIEEKCYYVSLEKENWFNAHRRCFTLNSTLVVFDDEKDMKVVTASLKVLGLPFSNGWTDSIWTGITSLGTNGHFVLSHDGGPLAYAQWAPNQPNNATAHECVAYANNNGFGYHNTQCDFHQFPFVCQAKKIESESYLCLKKNQFVEIEL